MWDDLNLHCYLSVENDIKCKYISIPPKIISDKGQEFCLDTGYADAAPLLHITDEYIQAHLA